VFWALLALIGNAPRGNPDVRQRFWLNKKIVGIAGIMQNLTK
jgi:hypothetical protein